MAAVIFLNLKLKIMSLDSNSSGNNCFRQTDNRQLKKNVLKGVKIGKDCTPRAISHPTDFLKERIKEGFGTNNFKIVYR